VFGTELIYYNLTPEHIIMRDVNNADEVLDKITLRTVTSRKAIAPIVDFHMINETHGIAYDANENKETLDLFYIVFNSDGNFSVIEHLYYIINPAYNSYDVPENSSYTQYLACSADLLGPLINILGNISGPFRFSGA
jgi:hypothetical protein